MQIIQVDSPGQILERRDECPGEDIVFSRLSETVLRESFKSIMCGMFDWDFTLIHERSQWHEVQARYLNGHLAEDEDRDRAFYYGEEPDYGKSPHPQNDWWLNDPDIIDISSMQAAYGTRSIMRWAQAGITREMLQSVGASLSLRAGVAEVFDCLTCKIVISFGIEELIEASLKANKLAAIVAANRLIYDEFGIITTHHPRVITNRTKGMIARAFIKKHRFPPEHIISIGDSIGDIEMMIPGAMNILLVPQQAVKSQIGKWRDGHLADMWEKTKCVIVSNSLWPVHKLLTGKE